MEPKVSPVNTAFRWGMLLALVNVIISLINYFAGNLEPDKINSPLTKVMQFAMYAIIILVLVLAMQQHRDKELGGYMKYGRGLGLGTLIGVFYGIVSAITAFVMFKYVMSADYTDRLLEMTRQDMMEKNPNMTDDQMEMGLSWARKFITPGGAALFAFIGSVALSFFFSLIVAAFVKKNNPEEIA
jgi:hypothetical protein